MKKKITAVVTAIALVLTTISTSNLTSTNAAVNASNGSSSWQLLWSDEFDQTVGGAPDSSIWSYDTGATGWGNAELQNYTTSTDNVYIADLSNDSGSSDGKGLAIKAIKNGNEYTSGRIHTQNKQYVKYGRIEAKLKVEKGSQNGVWPAFWMLGENYNPSSGNYDGSLGDSPWPSSGEIDIMEHRNKETDIIGTLHWNSNTTGLSHIYAGSETNGQFGTVDTIENWHTYAVEWYEDTMKWFVDGICYETMDITNAEMDEFQREHFILFNLALGSTNTPFTKNITVDSTFTDATMFVDYVRVFQGTDSSFSINKITEGITQPETTTGKTTGMLTAANDGQWHDLGAWSYQYGSWAGASGLYSGGANVNDLSLYIATSNKTAWGAMAKTDTINVTPGKTYNYSITVEADKAGASVLLKDELAGKDIQTKTLVEGENTFTGTYTPTSGTAELLFDFGKVEAGTLLKISSYSFEETSGTEVTTASSGEVATTAQGSVQWKDVTNNSNYQYSATEGSGNITVLQYEGSYIYIALSIPAKFSSVTMNGTAVTPEEGAFVKVTDDMLKTGTNTLTILDYYGGNRTTILLRRAGQIVEPETTTVETTTEAPTEPILVAPKDFSVYNYASHTGKYLLKFTPVTGATSYNLYIDDSTTPVKQISGSGDYITNDELSGYAFGNHTFYLTSVADGKETEKSAGITVTTVATGNANDIPQIYIQTDDKNISASNINKEMGKLNSSITVIDNNGLYTDIMEDVDGKTTIKVRGNSTAIADKKAYNITFNKKHDLFDLGFEYDGQGAGTKKWSLLANAFDKSLIRNKLAMDLCTDLGVPYTSQSQYVDVYMNGRSLGSFLLIESVEVGPDRVNIDSENPNTNDILLELENNGKDEVGVDYIHTALYNQRFNVNSPEHGDMFEEDSVEDTEALAKKEAAAVQFLNNFETALNTGKLSEVEKYMDIDTFVTFYLACEIFKTQDVNFSSTRFYITTDLNGDYKLYAGPPWDFDLSSGNVSPSFYGAADTSPENWQATDFIWFSKLMDIGGFKQKVIAKFYEKMSSITSMYEGTDSAINSLQNEYGNSFARNYTAANQGGAGWSATIKDSADGYSYANIGWASYDDSVTYLQNWLSDRVTWLKEQWPEDYITDEPVAPVTENLSEMIASSNNNLALNQTVTASSAIAEGSGTLSDLVSGRLDTPSYYATAFFTGPSYFTVDLGKTYLTESIDQIVMQCKDNATNDSPAGSGYSIQFSEDGQNWTIITSRSATQAASLFALNPVPGYTNVLADYIGDRSAKISKVRYVRIYSANTESLYGWQFKQISVLSTTGDIKTDTSFLSDEVKVEGYQMSASFGGVSGHMGFRTVYSCEPTINGKDVTEVGVIYGLVYGNNPITQKDITLDSKSEFVQAFAATANGVLDKQFGDSATATYYARTLDQANLTAEGYTVQYYVRAYAKLTDGSVAYGDVKGFTVYDVSDYMYQNKLMNNYVAHNYLHEKILKVVDSKYPQVEYGWSNAIVKPTI